MNKALTGTNVENISHHSRGLPMTTETAIKNAIHYLEKGCNCAQSVFTAVMKEKGLFLKQAPMLTAGFGGGIGLEGKTCGAIIGAVRALGMILSENEEDPVKVEKKAYENVHRLLKQFRNIHGTTIFSELLNVDMMDPEARKKASEEKIFHKLCPQFVKDAVRLTLEFIQCNNVIKSVRKIR